MGTKRVDGGAGIRWGNLIPMPEGRAENSGPATRTLSDLSSLYLSVAQDGGWEAGAGHGLHLLNGCFVQPGRMIY